MQETKAVSTVNPLGCSSGSRSAAAAAAEKLEAPICVNYEVNE